MTPEASTIDTGELHALADLLATLTPAADGVDLLDQFEALERIKSAVAAARAIVTATFADVAESETVPAGSIDYSPAELRLASNFTLAS